VWLRRIPHAHEAREAGAPGAPRAPADRSSDPVVGYAITRAAGSAVDRNRIRRRLRAAVERNEPALERGAAYLFGADRRVLHAPFPELDRAVRDLLRAQSEMSDR
jgi:ribonuclease P protein component